EELTERRRLLVERGRELALERTVRGLLRGRERERRLRRERARELERLRQQLVRWEDGADETAAERLVGVERTAGQDQLLRDAEPDHAGEPLRSAPARDDADVDLGLTEPCACDGVTDVARERELATAAEREPVHGC